MFGGGQRTVSFTIIPAQQASCRSHTKHAMQRYYNFHTKKEHATDAWARQQAGVGPFKTPDANLLPDSCHSFPQDGCHRLGGVLDERLLQQSLLSHKLLDSAIHNLWSAMQKTHPRLQHPGCDEVYRLDLLHFCTQNPRLRQHQRASSWQALTHRRHFPAHKGCW